MAASKSFKIGDVVCKTSDIERLDNTWLGFIYDIILDEEEEIYQVLWIHCGWRRIEAYSWYRRWSEQLFSVIS